MKKLCYRIVDAYFESNNDPWYEIDPTIDNIIRPHLAENGTVRLFPRNNHLYSVMNPNNQNENIVVKDVDLSSLNCPNFPASTAYAIDFGLEGSYFQEPMRVNIRI